MSFDPSRAIFSQVDTNRDGSIDQGEFSQFLGGAAASSGAGFGGSSSYESSQYTSGGLGGASGYESSSFSSGGYGGDAAYAGGADGSSSYESSASFDAGAGAGGFGESSSYESSASYGAGAGGAVGFPAGSGAQDYSASSYSSQTAVQTYATDAQGLFKDSNPQIIRRPAAGGVQTYTQNILVRFLQPPPIPPPGPLIIREVLPPQPPPPPPLRIRQQAPPLPPPPPLILRERPPQPPVATASQTVIRRLGAIPVPPRSVIIERLPALPPRPRDIVIERWIPYGAQAKRRTIVQRAAAAAQYARPRNVIIQYESVQVRVVRQFQRLGVVQANPQAYLQQYGAQLLESSALLQQARSAGVVEDISAPAGAAASSVSFGTANYGQEAGGFSSSANFASGSSNSAGADSGFAYEGGSAGEASAFESSGYGGEASAGFGGGFESSSSSFESSSYGGGAGGFDVAGAAFRSVDTNNDGSIDRAEFNRFYQQGI